MRMQLLYFIQMSLINQSWIQVLLQECQNLTARQEVTKIHTIYQFFKDNIRLTFTELSLDAIIKFTEIAVEIPDHFAPAKHIVELFFERVKTSNQFFVRALFVKAKVVAYQAQRDNLKGEDMLAALKESIAYITKALQLIAPQQESGGKGKEQKGGQPVEGSLKSKYSFLIYNASTTLFRVTRFMLRPGWQRYFTEIYDRVYRNLDELEEPDHNWKCRFCMILYQCLYDADKKPEAFKVLDTLWEKTKSKACEFQDSLFRLRVFLSKENGALLAAIKKDTQGSDPSAWKILEALQRMRCGLVPEPQVEKELMTVVNQISLGVLSNAESSAPGQLSGVLQERLAEAGRIALRFNLANLANSIVVFLSKTRQPSQNALILNEYNKAELLIKRKGEYVDKKTGMAMSAHQVRDIDIENRKQALRMLQKVMLINKKIANPDLIYQGAVLVWNTALPFLTPHYYPFCARALDISLVLLEQVDSTDHELRTKMHLQLSNIYFKSDLMFAELRANIFKALSLDPSVPPYKLAVKGQPEQEPSIYTQPYRRYLLDFKQKVLLKLNEVAEQSDLDVVTQNLWTLEGQKSETTKIDTIQGCLKTLLSWKDSEFKLPSTVLVQQEVQQLRVGYEREKLRNYKRSKLLAFEISKLSFEWELNDFCKKACELVLADRWEAKNAVELIIAQAHCALFMAQIRIDQLYQSNVEPLFQGEQSGLSEAERRQARTMKEELLGYLRKTLDHAASTQQTYLVFNGAICIWNNFLHIFKVNANDSKIRTQFHAVLKDYFEAMRNNLRDSESKGIVAYDSDDKIQAFSNIGIVYSRILQSQKQTPLVEKVCEDLLLTNLSPNVRKIVNGIKARVSGGKASTGTKPADPKKGAPVVQKIAGFNDNFILQANNQLQSIRNCANKAESETLVVKCSETLQNWQPNQQDETQLQLHAELWVKLARLACNLESSRMLKLALKYSQSCVKKYKGGGNPPVPSNRLRWYSLAYFISSQTLLKLVNPRTQQASSVEGLLVLSLGRGCQAAALGFKCGISLLVVDACKQAWNVCVQLQESRSSRKQLLQPLKSLVGYLKEMKEDSEPDLLLLMGQLYFRCAWENGLHAEGEAVADCMLDLLPKGLHRPVWEAKMVFMSKQGKNELQAISSIKEADPSLQAKLWLKLARIAPNTAKQHASYTKALEILKKEHSIQMVEVLIEYSEWQLRVGREPLEAVAKSLEYANNLLVEIEPPCELDEEEYGDDRLTLNSHNPSKSHRSKKSANSRSVKGSQKDFNKDKKPAPSAKSKASGLSRMNRSGQAAKSLKNKNTKSLFSVREEEASPEALNCLHFERLFRINTIQATIHSSPQQKRIYAFNAYGNVLSMLRKSIETFNQLQENAAKVNEKDDQPRRIVTFPTSIDQWVSYELPPEYLQKVDKIQNFNFLGSYALEKPELTYCYLNKLIAILEQMGLNYHTLPLLFTAKYLTKHIIKNEHYSKLEALKLKRTLALAQHPLESSLKIRPQDFAITQEESRQEIIKAEYQKSNALQQQVDSQQTPNLIQPLSKYLCWLSTAELLIDFGEIALAKSLLGQTIKCAKVVGNPETIGKVHLLLSRIAFLQGEHMEAIQQLSVAHRLCKAVGEWQAIAALSSKVMLGVKKPDLLKAFLTKIGHTAGQLIQESGKQGRERSSFAIELDELRQLELAVHIAMVQLAFHNITEEDTRENRAFFASALATLHSLVAQPADAVWNVANNRTLTEVFQEIVALQESKGGSRILDLGSSNFQLCFEIMQYFYRSNKQFLRVAGLKESQGANYNAAFKVQTKLAFLLVSAHLVLHSQSTQDQVFSQSDDLTHSNLTVQAYFAELNKDITRKNAPFQGQLSNLESSLAILNDLEAHIDDKSPAYPKLQALQLLVHSSINRLSQEAIQLGISFRTTCEQKLEGIDSLIDCLPFQAKAFEALIEQLLDSQNLQAFEYLSKFQHVCSVEYSLKFLRRKLVPAHPCLAALRLLQNASCCSFKESLCKKEKLLTSLTTFNTFEENVKLVARNSIQVVLQMNKSRTKVYCGMLITEGDLSQRRVSLKAKEINLNELKLYEKLQEELLAYKKAVTKTPYDDHQKLAMLSQTHQPKLKDVKSTLQHLSAWWLKQLLQLLSTPKASPNAGTVDNGKKGAKEQKKKGGKDQIAGYQSPVPPSPSGIESVTFLLDSFFYGLPFEELLSSELISTVSKDHSFFWLTRKLQQIGFQAELNNSSGFASEKGKYFAYDYKLPQLNFKNVVAEVSKSDSLKWEGIESTTRLPSLGDYAQSLNRSGFMQIYGSIDLMNHLKLSAFTESVGASKVKLMLVHDSLNFHKSSLVKYRNLNTEGPTVAFEENQQSFALVANLLNATLIKNRWAATPETVISQAKELYKGLASGIYVGAALRQSRKDTQKIAHQWMCYVHGPPIIRL